MKKILTLLSFLIALQLSAQTPFWVSINNYQKIRGVWGDSVLRVATDTTKNKTAGSLAYVNSQIYFYNTKWRPVASGSIGSGISAVYAGDCLIQVDDSTLALDPACAGNDNIGAGYRLAVPGTIGVKTVYGTNGILVDSTTNTDAITFSLDTSQITFSSDTTIINNTIFQKSILIPRTDTVNAKQKNGSIIFDTIYRHYMGYVDGTWFCLDCSGGGGGSVSSVGLTAANLFNVTGSPVTGSGTLAFDWTGANQGSMIYFPSLNTAAYLGKSTTAGQTITNGGASNNPQWDFPFDLTTTGTTGPATYSGRTLNIPEYSAGSSGVTSWNGGTTGMTPNTATTGAVTMAGTLITSNGGTGLSSYTTDDMIYWHSGTAFSKLAKGSNGQHLIVNGSGNYAWVDSTASSAGLFYALASGGTSTASNTFTFNTANWNNWAGTFTTTANNQYFQNFSGTIDLRATTSETVSLYKGSPVFNKRANGQEMVVLDFPATFNANTFTGGGNTLLRGNGDIYSSTNNTYNIGKSTNIWLSAWATTTNTNNVTSIANAGMVISASAARATIILHPTTGSIRVGSNLTGPDSAYKLNLLGEIKSTGLVTNALPTPTINTITQTGTGGAVTYKYKLVFRNADGTHSAASAEVTTNTGNATMSGTNQNQINFTASEATSEGAAWVDLYRTFAGAGALGNSATTGLIRSVQTYNSSSITDQGGSGGGETPPTENTSSAIGINNLRPHSNFQDVGSFALNYVAVTGTYTATTLDQTVDCTSGTFTVTLPTAVGITGRIYTIVNSGSGTITIGTTSSQTFVNINGTPTTLTLGAVGAGAIVSYSLMSNGANWIVTAKVKNE